MKLWVTINNVSSACVVLKWSWSGVGWELKMFPLVVCVFWLAKFLTEDSCSKVEWLVAHVACALEQNSQHPRSHSFYSLRGHGFLLPFLWWAPSFPSLLSLNFACYWWFQLESWKLNDFQTGSWSNDICLMPCSPRTLTPGDVGCCVVVCPSRSHLVRDSSQRCRTVGFWDTL